MNYLTEKEVFETFRDKCNLEENYSFLAEDLEQLAQKMIEEAAPKIIAAEREKCVTFVRSLNTQVAQALEDFKGEV
jgi:phosphoribosyl-ATP pyrophosphohydrolase